MRPVVVALLVAGAVGVGVGGFVAGRRVAGPHAVQVNPTPLVVPPSDAIRMPDGHYKDPKTGGYWVAPDSQLDRDLFNHGKPIDTSKMNKVLPCGHPMVNAIYGPGGDVEICDHGHRWERNAEGRWVMSVN